MKHKMDNLNSIGSAGQVLDLISIAIHGKDKKDPNEYF